MLSIRKITVLPLILLLITVTLSSCVTADFNIDKTATGGKLSDSETGIQNSDKFPYTFTDSTGYKTTLSEKPKKVAVLFSSYADIWKTAGGSVSVTVGESVKRGFADDGAVLIDEGSGHTTINLETLIAQAPDLVIGTADYECQVNAVEFCRSVGIPSALFKVESFSDYLGFLRIACDITGDEEAYTTHGIAVRDRIELLLKKVSEKYHGNTPVRILFVRAGSSARSTKAKTSDDNFACAMLKELGVENIADTQGTLTGTLSLEVIVQKNPEYMFITMMGDETAAKEYFDSTLTLPGWRDIECVKNLQYSYLPKDLFHFKPNARWDKAYEYLIDLLYPDFEV